MKEENKRFFRDVFLLICCFVLFSLFTKLCFNAMRLYSSRKIRNTVWVEVASPHINTIVFSKDSAYMFDGETWTSHHYDANSNYISGLELRYDSCKTYTGDEYDFYFYHYNKKSKTLSLDCVPPNKKKERVKIKYQRVNSLSNDKIHH